MSRRALVALAALAPLLAACTQVAPMATPAPQASLAVPAEVSATPSPSDTPSATPSATPSETATPSATPSATSAKPKPTPTASKTATPAPAAAPAGARTADPDGCATQVIRVKSTGKCVLFGLKLLKKANYYSPTPGSTFGTAAVNWTLQYQRSRGLDDTGRLDAPTWEALLAGRAQLPVRIPDSCRTSGVVLCVSKAQGKLYWLKNGTVKKTTSVRFGGWNTDAKTGAWRMFGTVNGTYRVYNKHPNPTSENYGAGAMPYSTMFDPNMYVHYSSGFASVGYSGSSHGCVNVRSRTDAKWIMDNTPIGAKVVVYEG